MRKRIASSILCLIVGLLVIGLAASLFGCDRSVDYLPDLRVESISVEQPVVRDETAVVTVTVWNRGVGGTGASSSVLVIVAGELYEWHTPRIGPREYTSVSGFVLVSEDWTESVTLVSVYVDANDDIIEGCETNNEMGLSVVVVSAPVAEVTE